VRSWWQRRKISSPDAGLPEESVRKRSQADSGYGGQTVSVGKHRIALNESEPIKHFAMRKKLT